MSTLSFLALVTAGTALTDAQIQSVFEVPGLEDLTEDLPGFVAKAKESKFFLTTAARLRDSLALGKEGTKEQKQEGNALRMLLMSGPDFADTLIYFQPPKKTAQDKVDTKPSWQLFLYKRILSATEDFMWDTANALLANTDFRKEIAEKSEGFPESVTNFREALIQGGRFQVNYTVTDPEKHPERMLPVPGHADKLVALSYGWRNDQFRTEAKKKDAKTEGKPGKEPEAQPQVNAEAAPAPTDG